ncbi:hypothetical protein BDN70DRAFT_663619 [Pholiota conissans]|uniref:Uncharacterized protein n=1 Tax=Pholiota conissans TaxID=109636 RepID=A0A9P5Z4A0_9AGAR|nr:hypothetical protein BDN70DRAFT_663619 [Pholiota conissans]
MAKKLDQQYTKSWHDLECSLWDHAGTEFSDDVETILEHRAKVIGCLLKMTCDHLEYLLVKVGKDIFMSKSKYIRSLIFRNTFALDVPVDSDLDDKKSQLHRSIVKKLYKIRANRIGEDCVEAVIMRVRLDLPTVYEEGIATLLPGQPYPTFDVFWRIVRTKDNFVDHSLGKPAEFSVFEKVMELWKEEVKDQKLIEIIRKTSPEYTIFDPDTVLGLATTFFVCRSVDCPYRRSGDPMMPGCDNGAPDG